MASIFREQNLKRVSTPDTLDDYIRIANPGVWMVLIAIILLLVAAIVWGIFGTVNVDASGLLIVEDDEATLWLQEQDATELTSGAEVKVADVKGLVTGMAGAPQAVSEVFETGVSNGGEQVTTEGVWVRPFPVSIELPDGDYPATAIVQTFSPLELIFGAGQTADISEGQAQ